jgi:ubiquinone/menaquinone biosynthesis C-methylase UbiE
MIATEKSEMEALMACNVCRSACIQKVDPEFNLCRCDTCGYVFDSPRPSFAQVMTFYSQTDKYDAWLTEERGRDRLWKRRLKKLLRRSPEGSLLDIGAGIGQFLHHAEPLFATVIGTEVSESAIALAKEKYGLELLAGQVEDLDLPPSSFDNISLFHVLEHVPDPRMLIARCHTMLKPKGLLLVAVPNDVLAWTSQIKKLGKSLGLKPFQKFSATLGISRAGASREIHLSHFTPSVLRQLIETFGLQVVEESLDPCYVSNGGRLLLDYVYYVFHQLLHAVLKINRYDTIWMVARKP